MHIIFGFGAHNGAFYKSLHYKSVQEKLMVFGVKGGHNGNFVKVPIAKVPLVKSPLVN